MTNPILQDLQEVMRLLNGTSRERHTGQNKAEIFLSERHATIEQAVRDAERYRWLRDTCYWSDEVWYAIENMAGTDEAIDAAMAQEKGRDNI